MTAGLVEEDLSAVAAENAATAGQRLYVQYGITGVRGQMEAGLPAVLTAGLPVLERGLMMGKTVDEAGCAALLALMTAAEDTNLIVRSDRATQQQTVEQIADLLRKDPYPTRAQLEALDELFVKKNLSPGGSADLLAITYLLCFLNYEL